MVVKHDFVKYPELRDGQLSELEFVSPHVQIKDDFRCVVDRVVDGDTVVVLTSFRDFVFPIRFLDIDAPEMNEGGAVAKAWLAAKIEGFAVDVLVEPTNRVDKYGRLLGRIVYNGLDVGEEMLHLGLAVPFGSKDEGVPESLDKLFRVGQWV